MYDPYEQGPPPLMPVDEADPLETISAPPERAPRAGTALLIMLAFFGTQLAGFLLVGLVAGVYAGLTGVDGANPEALRKVVEPFIIYSMLPVFLISGLPVMAITRARAADVLNDGSPTGVGWQGSTPPAILFSLLLGAAFAFGCLFLYGTVFTEIKPDAGSPIAQMASTGPLAQLLLAVMVVVVAPLLEEVLFRGVMLAGFTRSFGLPVAVILCTSLFVAAHTPELMRYPPGTIGIGGLAFLAIWLRLKTKSVFPAMAVHAGYNGLLVALMALAPLLQQ